jgi:hypothetical protein
MHLEIDRLEVRPEVGRAVAAAELDDGDALAGAVSCVREVVEVGELDRRK